MKEPVHVSELVKKVVKDMKEKAPARTGTDKMYWRGDDDDRKTKI